jgi:DNA-binding beta-propeller fold protein YncE
MYVADAGNARVQCFESDGAFVREWSDGAEPLVEPFDIAVDAAGRVFVLDVGRQSIIRYSAEGDFQQEIGSGLGLYGPRGLGLDAEGNIYVADTGGQRVVKLSSDGQLLKVLAQGGDGVGQVNQPTDVAVDQLGRVYVVEPMLNRLQVLDAAGGFLGSWAISGANTTDGPHLDVDSDGRILVTDPEAHVVVAFDASGAVLGRWGGEGVAPGQFRKTLGIGVGPDGLVAVSDVYNHRVQVFSIAGMNE